MREVWEVTATLVREIGLTGVVDITIMAVVIYACLVWLRRTRRSALTLTGVLIVSAAYLAARQLDLRLTTAVLQGFFAVILIALVVIFQEELRYAFERIAQFGLRRKRAVRTEAASGESAGILGRTLLDLARARVGALIALPVGDPIARHLEGGVTLDGIVSEPLLKSLFDPHSLGHDGAVVIEGGRVTQFGCHLPLSRSSTQLAGVGTRHAAALGLAERTDAYCLVVSEERGAISLARHGNLRVLDGAAELAEVLEHYVSEITPGVRRSPLRVLRRNHREKLVAIALSLALWFVLVHEARVGYRTFRVPVSLSQLPAGLAVQDVQPRIVEVTVSAPRRSLYFLSSTAVSMNLRAWEIDAGTRTLPLDAGDFSLPPGVTLEHVDPMRINVMVTPARPAGAGG